MQSLEDNGECQKSRFNSDFSEKTLRSSFESHRTNGAGKVIGDFSVHAEPLEAFLGFFTRINSPAVNQVPGNPGCLCSANYECRVLEEGAPPSATARRSSNPSRTKRRAHLYRACRIDAWIGGRRDPLSCGGLSRLYKLHRRLFSSEGTTPLQDRPQAVRSGHRSGEGQPRDCPSGARKDQQRCSAL